jgi:hypothetical protein
VHGVRYAVHCSRYAVHGVYLVGRDRGAKRECESWTRAGEDGVGSVRAPQRSANTPKPVQDQDGSQAE